jgi:hypothetical protein
MRAATLLLSVALGLGACSSPQAQTQAPADDPPTLAQLFVAERYDELELLAAGVIDDPEQDDRERVAEARFFRALAWLAQDPPGKQPRALFELRKLELEDADLLWGHLAGLHVTALTRVEVLQLTLLELAIEQGHLQVRIDALEGELADRIAERSKREADLAALTRERNDLLEKIDEARKQATVTAARLRELEDELAALKQIDMQREP